METMIANKAVSVNEEGYLTDFSQWDKTIAEEIARQSEINMTSRHWDVINYVQDQFRKDIPLTIRKVGKSGVVDIKEFYQLFPSGPLKTSTKIAGIPKPVSCI